MATQQIERSEQDYADLLVSSGYLTLVQLSAQLRHAATQPEPSETVRGDVLLQRQPQPVSAVTVHSEAGPILFSATGDIKAQASRQPQKVLAFASCTSGPCRALRRSFSIGCSCARFSSATPPRGWGEPSYEAVQSASYIDDPLHPGFARLDLTTSLAAVLHEEVLIQGSSQPEGRHSEHTFAFKAHTFDWWIPVRPRPAPARSSSTTLRAENRQVASHAAPTGRAARSRSTRTVDQRLDRRRASRCFPGARSGLGGWCPPWPGHHREMAETTVRMQVTLDWQGEHLRVVIKNRPEDRNYVVFLVVEETFGSIEPDEVAPKVLHTALPIHINGQLTFVPQALFDQEQAARDKQRAFASRFAVSVQPQPGEPVFGSIRLGELTTDAGLRATLPRRSSSSSRTS